MSIITRPVALDDKARWQSLYESYQAFYERADLPQGFYDSAFDRLIAGTEVHGLVAEDETGQLLGLTHYLYHAHMWRPEGVCYLQDLFTVPEARGRGVGRALIEAVYAAADAAGRPAVYWLTQEFNYAGRMLYDKIASRSPFIRYNRPL